MSVYGYPREPEGTGDEIPPPDVPYRVTSQPVPVPNNPPPASVEPLRPPQPLLPPHPPTTPYTPGDFIPFQRQAPDPDTVRVAASGTASGRTDERESRPRHQAETEEESDSGFHWLRPSRSNPASAASAAGSPSASAAGSSPSAESSLSTGPSLSSGPSLSTGPSLFTGSSAAAGPSGPASPPPFAAPSLGTAAAPSSTDPVSGPASPPPFAAPAPGVAESSSGSLPHPVSPSGAMGQPPAGASAWAGPSPAMGQPGLADRPGSGAFPLMGQPPVTDGATATGGAPSTDGSPAASGPADEPGHAQSDAPGDGADQGGSGLPRRRSPYAAAYSPSYAGGPAATAVSEAPSAGTVPTSAPPASAPPSEPAPDAPPTSAPSEFRPGPAAPSDFAPPGFGPPAEPGSSTGVPGSPTGPASTVPPGSVPPMGGAAPEIQPWDRRPLLVVIASAIVLVLIGILSGVVTATLASNPRASWHEGEPAEPGEGALPTADPSATAPAGETETITLSGVGDVIMGSVNLGVPPNNGAGFFDAVRDALAADLVMGNLDQALSEPTGYEKCEPDTTDCFQLSLPPSYAEVLRDGGFDLMNLANNHTYDMGPAGYANTRAALESVGIAATGGVDEITYLTVKGVRVAVLGFSVYSYTANLNDIEGAVDLVRQAAAKADLVVVQMQGGAEGADRTHVPPAGQHEMFGGENRGDLRSFAHAVVDAGADIVFGHGPHVMRGMEFYRGRLIAYSLGNFCGYAVLSSTGWSGVGGILKVTLTRDGTWVAGELIATEMVNRGFPALDEERRALAFVDELSVADFGDAAARIDHTTGVITAP